MALQHLNFEGSVDPLIVDAKAYSSADREDGTLLRAKATPNGIRGYLIGKLVTVSEIILAYLTIILIPGLFIVDGLDIGGFGSWLTLAWVLLLGRQPCQ